LILLQRSTQRLDAPSRRRNRPHATNENLIHCHLRNTSVAFAPPKPNELVNA